MAGGRLAGTEFGSSAGSGSGFARIVDLVSVVALWLMSEDFLCTDRSSRKDSELVKAAIVAL